MIRSVDPFCSEALQSIGFKHTVDKSCQGDVQPEAKIVSTEEQSSQQKSGSADTRRSKDDADDEVGQNAQAQTR